MRRIACVEKWNEEATRVWNNTYTRWRIIWISSGTILSSVFTLLTQNIRLTIGFIVITGIIDLLVELNEYIQFDFFLKRIFRRRRIYRYLRFIFLAVLPAISGIFEMIRYKIINQELLVK